MPQYVFVCVASGLLSAIIYGAAASNFALSFVAIYLAPLPLFMVGLMHGGASALIAGLTGAGALSLASSPVLALAYFAFNAAAPALVTRAALWSREIEMDNTRPPHIEWYPAGLLFVWLCGLGMALVTMLYLVMQTQEGGITGSLSKIMQLEILTKTILQAQLQTGSAPLDEAALQQILIRLALPALAFFWIMIAAGNGALAQRLLVLLERNGRPSPRLTSMRLPGYMLPPLILGLIGAFLPGDAGLAASAIATLAATPYFFLGLATLHVISRRWPGRGFALAVFYVLMVIYGWPALVMVTLGILEHFASLRRPHLSIDSL